MKKLLLITAVLFSSGVWAQIECSQLSNIADNNFRELDALILFKVSTENGIRTYFHSAPSKTCKNTKVFVIPSDSIIGYYSFNNEDHEWIYAVYTSKNKTKFAGWLLKKNLVSYGTTALDD